MSRATVVILADDHCGSPLGLFPGDVWELEDGNAVHPNAWQQTLWTHLLDCAARVAELRRGGRLVVIHAGDAVEGVHHGTTQLLSTRPDEQERLHVAAMREFLRLIGWRRQRDRLIYLAGTEAHAGSGNSSTERIARQLLDTDDLDGGVVRSRLVGRIEGVLFDVAHRGYALGGRSWTRSNSMRAYLESRWNDALKHGQAMPRYVVRAHRHTYGYAELWDDEGATVSEAFLMPSFKLRDDYAYALAPEAVSSIGLLAFRVEDGAGRPYPLLMRCDQDVVEEL